MTDAAAQPAVQVVAGNHAVTREIFGHVPPEHPVELRFADLTDPFDVTAATDGAHAVVVDDEALTRAHINAFASSVRVIGKLGTGLDSVDVEAARERGVAVVYFPGSAVNEVADHTLALMLASVRNLRAADPVARDAWTEWRRVGGLRTLSDCTIGMVGLGRIGGAVLRRLRPFGCRLLVVDPVLDAPPEGATLIAALDDLLREADIVTIHVPLSAKTEGLIGPRELALMKPGALIVNTTRGGVIDQPALAAALADGRLGGAALDVLVAEPPAPDDPILSAPRTLLSPHVAWYSQAAELRMRDHTLQAVADLVHGVPLRFGTLAT